MKTEWHRPEPNAHGVPVRKSKCGKALIATYGNSYIPQVGYQNMLPRYYRLAEAKAAVEAVLNGQAAPAPVSKPTVTATYENIGGPNVEGYERVKATIKDHLTNKGAAAEDPYAVLGLPQDVDDLTVRRRVKQLQRELHPDNHGDPERFRAVQEAWNLIRQDVKA